MWEIALDLTKTQNVEKSSILKFTSKITEDFYIKEE
jgi:hypothetical protein